MLMQMNKMREQKGFTLVELMIVVAIIGILAAVAVPYYQRYVAKARVTSLVMPGARAIQNSVTTFYSVRQDWPTEDQFNTAMMRDADTRCFNVVSPGEITEPPGWGFRITLTPDEDGCGGLKSLGEGDVLSFTLSAEIIDDRVLSWGFSGQLPTELGL